MSTLMDQMQILFRSQHSRFKINVSFGFILKHIETGELRYYHSSQNIGRLLEVPHLVSNQRDFDTFLDSILVEDVLEWARQQRPDTKWIVLCVTNVTVFVNKLPHHLIGNDTIVLPDYIKRRFGLIALDRDGEGHKLYDDNLCFFRALVLHKGMDQKPTSIFEAAVKQKFRELTGGNPFTYEGLKLSDLPTLETKLNMNINVFELVKRDSGDIVGRVVQRSFRQYSDTMNLNLYEDHFSLITNLDRYCQSYECPCCHKLWKHLFRLNRHIKSCSHVTKHKYVGGSYQNEPTVFELLEDEGMVIPKQDRFYPYRITYDFECYFDRQDVPTCTEKLQWQAKHVPLSLSICSNVPDFEQPKCFITPGTPSGLVNNMVEYMHSIQARASSLVAEQHGQYYNELLQLIDQKEKLEPKSERDENDHREEKSHPLYKTKLKYDTWMKEIPVIGFNSGKYDINLIKPYLVQVLQISDPIQFVVKKSNAFLCLKTERLKFLDILNYLAPGFDYATYLKAYKSSVIKGYFPYEWMDNLTKLNQTYLPTHQQFYSSLKNSNISEDQYAYCQRIWQEERMKTFKDYLVWYNNRDVVPFMEALAKQFNFYVNLGLDMFKDGLSVPGLTLKYLFLTCSSTMFTLFNHQNQDLHHMVRQNMVGGPSIIFHRYHEAWRTKIREHYFGNLAKPCQSIIGYDANALYLWCLMQDMPTGFYVRRKACNQFKPYYVDKWGQMALQWLEWEAYQGNVHIRHKYNGKEKRIGRRNLSVDGWCSTTNTVYQFHGCFWHGHSCMVQSGKMQNTIRGKTMIELRLETEKNSQYIRKCGYTLVEMWECEWKKIRRQYPEIRQFTKPLHYKQTMVEIEILEAVKTNRLFGMVECDIVVPEHLKDYFSEMTPIFKNIDIHIDDIGAVMKDYAIQNKLMSQPRRSLIGSYAGYKILLITPLLQWYLNHGLIVTKIYEVIEYEPKTCFKQFGDNVSNARRKGDADPDQEILASTMKLIGNSGYGRTITNKDRHRDIYFIGNEKEVSKKVNEPQFRQLQVLPDDMYEIEMSKKVIKYDLPLQIGFFVYQYAKLRMLAFYFDFVDKYLNREDFQYIEMDTDSAYLALAGENMEDLVKPHLREQFYQEWPQWLPAMACTKHQSSFVETKMEGKEWHQQDCCKARKMYDKRTPGLFKVEWEGTGMVGLCSKTYFGWGVKDKCSTKGISKSHNILDQKTFLEVLTTKQSKGGINVGFQLKDQTLYTYRQQRNALSYFYPKRKVLEDGITTEPLSI